MDREVAMKKIDSVVSLVEQHQKGEIGLIAFQDKLWDLLGPEGLPKGNFHLSPDILEELGRHGWMAEKVTCEVCGEYDLVTKNMFGKWMNSPLCLCS